VRGGAAAMQAVGNVRRSAMCGALGRMGLGAWGCMCIGGGRTRADGTVQRSVMGGACGRMGTHAAWGLRAGGWGRAAIRGGWRMGTHASWSLRACKPGIDALGCIRLRAAWHGMAGTQAVVGTQHACVCAHVRGA
jgi:hypothetical protein